MAKTRFTQQYDRFLERLRALRGKEGLRQVDLAERLGIPQQYISRFENGETRMDIVQVWQYCQATGRSFSAFCKQLDREFSKSGK